MKTLLFKFHLQRFAADGGAGGGAGGESDGGGAGGKGGEGGDKAFSQADVDKIISQRLAREQKAWETKMAEEKKKSEMTEQEKLKAAAAEAEGKGKAAIDAANARLVTAEARVIASSAGVPAEKIAYVLKLADLSGIEVDEKGNVNEKLVKSAIEAVLKDLPELKGAGAGGFNISGNPPGGGAAKGGMNAFIRRAAGR